MFPIHSYSAWENLFGLVRCNHYAGLSEFALLEIFQYLSLNLVSLGFLVGYILLGNFLAIFGTDKYIQSCNHLLHANGVYLNETLYHIAFAT